ncbi:uncharacterized protein BDR25DRAFT_357609 [Lindgomyces ingoldianus]|uniref:Uncharacterized protein n=1 Tax=Lindgomyces ingoldianus TaxID=673940 RepID=A0ACB6QPV2_9PLEO|nr:uncharacterized protein BDR25DRAFT_357609 [Lindgomyces ingoldianus]KAF2468312.1 hypothetical protein BDR25DRAFT_357609 [Lindgomyces ingoldianus]
MRLYLRVACSRQSNILSFGTVEIVAPAVVPLRFGALSRSSDLPTPYTTTIQFSQFGSHLCETLASNTCLPLREPPPTPPTRINSRDFICPYSIRALFPTTQYGASSFLPFGIYSIPVSSTTHGALANFRLTVTKELEEGRHETISRSYNCYYYSGSLSQRLEQNNR